MLAVISLAVVIPIVADLRDMWAEVPVLTIGHCDGVVVGHQHPVDKVVCIRGPLPRELHILCASRAGEACGDESLGQYPLTGHPRTV